MEQSVNTFNKGLQMDTNPMMLNNTTLTDALNATIITMNGNEVVLQNDMGNRRIDNAFLPSGYEPVGIKEYGGVIYIAAYNPITNKSQIGSFPSPERKIGPSDDNDLKGNLNFFGSDNSDFKIEINDDEIKFLKNDTVLIPLTKDTSLHAGDKFVVYSNGLSEKKQNITNYENINEESGKVISPKNKQYTLSLGILNSQNEFVDITNSLVRWKEEKIIEHTNKSDLYKFNDGYFIPDSFTGPDEDETISDKELIKERLTYPVNTYSYKLVGPLYLKAHLNHLKTFNYDISGFKDETNVTLYITADITYNCPDYLKEDFSSIIDNGDDNYDKYEIGYIADGWFDFYYETTDNYDKASDVVIIEDEINNKIKYDPINNIYSVIVKKKITIPITELKKEDNGTTKYLNYWIAVNTCKGIDNVYIKELSHKGTIDLDKLGTGTIDLKGWRFYNNLNKSSLLTYTLEGYPKPDCKFDTVSLKFEQVVPQPNQPEPAPGEDSGGTGGIDKKSNIEEQWVIPDGTGGGGSGNVYITNIHLFGQPRTEYYVGEIFDAGTLKATFMYSNGSKSTYNITSSMCTFNSKKDFNTKTDSKNKEAEITKIEVYGTKVNNEPIIFNYTVIKKLEEQDEPTPPVYEKSNSFNIEENFNNGRTTIELNWNKHNIKPRQLYKVTITVTNPCTEIGTFTATRWFLSTELMNNSYNSNSSEFIADYGNPEKGKEEETLNKLLTINIGLDSDVVNDSKLKYFVETIKNYKIDDKEYEYDLIGSYSEDLINPIRIAYKHKYNLNLKIFPKLKIKNEELYPDFIKIPELDISDLKVLDIILNEFSGEILDIAKNANLLSYNKDKFVDKVEFSQKSFNINKDIYFYDQISASKTTEGSITNAFGDIETHLFDKIIDNSFLYAGIAVDYDAHTGPDDDHYLHLLYSTKPNMKYHYKGDPGEGGEQLSSGHNSQDKHKHFYYNEYKYKINSVFNKNINEDLVFTFNFYCEDNWNGTRINNTRDRIHLSKVEHGTNAILSNRLKYNDSDFSGRGYYTRVWWRTTTDNWALFNINPDIREILVDDNKTNINRIYDYNWHTDYYEKTNIKKFIKSFLKKQICKDKKIIYCFKNNLKLNELDLYKPSTTSYKYNNEYSLTSNLNIKVLSKDNLSLDITNIIDFYKLVYSQFIKPNESYSDLRDDTILHPKSTITNLSDNIVIPIVLESSDKFLNDMNNLLFNDVLSNIYIDNGTNIDSEGNGLNKNSFYSIGENEELIKQSYPISIKAMSNGYNTILYSNNDNKSTPTYICDAISIDENGSGESLTTFTYDSVTIVEI